MRGAAAMSSMSVGRSQRQKLGPNMSVTNMISIGLSAVWLAACGSWILVVSDPEDVGFDRNGIVAIIYIIIFPIVLIWIVAFAVRLIEELREESRRLHVAIAELRQAYTTAQRNEKADHRSEFDKRLEDLLRSQKRTEALLAQFPTERVQGAQPAAEFSARQQTRPLAARTEPDTAQPFLALGAPDEERDPISTDEFIKALNFPEDEGDKEGFRALRIALNDHTTAALIRSAQDVLTLLAEDGIYMDDLTPDRSRPEVWRKFAMGVRGPAISSLGGIRDRSSLALTAGRMRQDAVFRDVAHHFLRKFDQTFTAFEKAANDADIAALADTRTVRAFMLLGRVSGTFD